MREPIVVTEKEYTKGKKVFDAAADRYDWIVCDGAEDAVARAVRSSGARVAVLGVEKYVGPLYEALAANGKGKPTLIARHGVGYDGVSVDLCKAHGNILTITKNAPDMSVAEHSIALVLALAKRIPAGDADMRSGNFMPLRGFELSGKTIGIAGVGNIGRHAARMASFGFGMRVVAFGTSPESRLGERDGCSSAAFKEKYGIAEYTTDFAAFAGAADILSVYMPLRPQTVGYFSRERFSLMKEGAYFVNTSRGKLVDEIALYDALSSGRLASAALDVFDREPYVPAAPDKDLRKLSNIVLSAHAASNTEEANRNMQTNIVANIDAYLAGNLDKLTAVYRP